VREATVPSMVASGGHTEALERICDALAEQLNAERVVVTGAGHFVAAAPGFIQTLERFLVASG
jgi:pimeloyl-ACP methyl ester carboxylesterase